MYRRKKGCSHFLHRISRKFGLKIAFFTIFIFTIITTLLFIFSFGSNDNADILKSANDNDSAGYVNNLNENSNEENSNEEINKNDIYYPDRNVNSEEEEDKCELCYDLQKKYGNSTPRDLIITGVFGKEKKFKKFIRSLRSTGCKAKVVIVTNVSFNKEYEQLYKKCDVDIFIMKSPPETMNMYPHSLRYVGYQQYFDQLNGQTFDRVLHADSFDVFFQKDPFDKDIRNDRLYFTMEDVLIQNSSWNSGWLTRAYNESISESLGNFTVSCSGTLIGGFSQFLIYLNVLLNHKPFWLNGRHSLDQAYHNYLLHASAFEKAGIKPEFMGCNSNIVTMHYCGRIKQVVKNGRIYTPDGKIIPAIVHQYQLYQKMVKAINDVCP